MYGLGAILDLGQSDIYKSAVFSQALGAAGGYALMYDRSGNDYYQLNGPVPSVYGVEGSFLGGGQGLGIGWRGYTTGGLGVIFDQNGNDRYIAGEFAQGTGYFWGFGVLHDARGNDVYMSDRYGGGIGCHQAAGALVDESGNDIYAGKTAASLGAAWDIAVGLFIDHSGNDSYRADNMSKGAGSMQGIAWCLDLAGDDHYATQSSYTQGLSGTNTYRYHATGAMSWSFFLDAAGGSDHYNASERANNKSLATGSFNEDDPQMSRLYGLFLDVEEPLNLRQR